MNKDVEMALRALNNEFKVIKRSLDPLSIEFKKINSIEVELKKLKSDLIPKIKKLELDIRRAKEPSVSQDNRRVLLGYKNLENQLNKIKSELILLKKKPKQEKEESEVALLSKTQKSLNSKVNITSKNLESQINKINSEIKQLKQTSKKPDNELVSLFENQKNLNNKLKQTASNLKTEMIHLKSDISLLMKKPGIDKEQNTMLQAISENQSDIEKKIIKMNKEVTEKYKEQINSNRKMVVKLISENNHLQRNLERIEVSFEKLKTDIQAFKDGVQERDKNLTKGINVRKRHINQIVEELNQARKKAHIQGTIIAENKEKIDDMKVNLTQLKNNLSNLEKSNKNKVEEKAVEDLKLTFSRLEKKTISNISEIKARMRELERKIVGKKDIDQMQTTIQELETNRINKLDKAFQKVSKQMTELPNQVEDRLSNLKKVMRYIELLKTDTNKLDARMNNTEAKFPEINRLKSNIEQLNKSLNSVKMPKEEIDNALNYVEVIKKDHANIKTEYNRLDKRIDKLSETTADLELLKDIKADVIKAISKAEKAASIKNMVEEINEKLTKIETKLSNNIQNVEKDVDRINIKVENTSKILKDLDKVL